MAFSIYDILKEAEGDEGGAAQDAAPTEEPAQSEAPKEDDFNIDTSLDKGEDNGTDSGDDFGAADGGEEGGDDMGGEDMGNPDQEEENENDKDIFFSLPKEEQQMKIRELKKLYGNLYTSCVDLVDRIDDIDVSDDNKPYISRIYSAMTDIKTYIADYIIYIFPSKSYIENDITYNTYLMMINSIAGILDKIIDKENKMKEDNNSN